MNLSFAWNLSLSSLECNGSVSTPSSPVDQVGFDSTAALMSFVIFLALFGNGLVILAFYRFHELRTITNYFVVSLAVADILVASLSMPSWMYIRLSALSQIPRDKLLGKVLYYSWQYVDVLCSTASIVNLCMISVDRHLAINSPLTYHSRMTPKRAKASIAFAWLLAFFYASLSIVTVIGKLAGKIYAIFISFAAFFFPLLILIGVYSKIAFVALSQVRTICAANAGIEHGVQREHNVTFRRELRVTKMLGLVVGAFVLCWGPFFSIVVLYAVCSSCPDDYGWVNISKWLHYANSTLNPLVYMLFTRTFRSAFRRLIVRGLCCKTLPLGGTRFNLNIWKVGSVEPTEMLKTYRETTKVHQRITQENLGEMTGNMEHTKSMEGTKIRQLSVITGT